MLDTKDFVYAIASGLVGHLSVSAGMAGDDGITHSFAAKYEPAAATIVQGISSAGQAGFGLPASDGRTSIIINTYRCQWSRSVQRAAEFRTALGPPPGTNCCLCVPSGAALRCRRAMHNLPIRLGRCNAKSGAPGRVLAVIGCAGRVRRVGPGTGL